MASTENGVPAKVGEGERFYTDNMIYYERNPYFYTVGAELENAKIKYVRYKVVATDQITNYLITKNVDFGEPNAIPANVKLMQEAGLESGTVRTNGYGYVGINPRFVPEVKVRQAIMMAMNKQIIIDNYYQNLADKITRPVSKASWAYPEEALEVYPFDKLGDDIEDLVRSAGYVKDSSTGVYQKQIAGFGVDKLDYKFTIAGSTTDHPAYKMFIEGAKLLNQHGFNVKVVTSPQALTDLNAGRLEVWAAAWSSSIDPDMYQTYHMESQASSVKNWGYSQIIGGGPSSAAWGDEYAIISELSDLIDKGRATTSQEVRKGIYAEAYDKIMEFAVEFPTYQRKDLFAFQKGLLDMSTLPSLEEEDGEIGPFSGVLARIWEINYAK